MGKFRLTKETFEDTYEVAIGHALNEGWAILNENLAAKSLANNIVLFKEKEVGDIYEQIAFRRRARVAQGEVVQNHYWLGQRIVAALFMDGYREDDDNLIGLASDKEMRQRRKNGLTYAREFLGRLDLDKIADKASRQLFEETRIETENIVKIQRKVWVAGENAMQQIWKMDKKDRLLDYLCSTKKKKRKIGQERFLELFGK